MDNAAHFHFLISLENPRSETALPGPLLPEPEPSTCRFPQRNTLGRLGPCTSFQAFLTQRLPPSRSAQLPPVPAPSAASALPLPPAPLPLSFYVMR